MSLPKEKATPDRWQGLERPNIVAWHPLAGQRELPEFNLDLGRLNVMLTRSTTRLTVVTRADQPAVFAANQPSANQPSADAPNPAWHTHVAVLDQLNRGPAAN